MCSIWGGVESEPHRKGDAKKVQRRGGHRARMLMGSWKTAEMAAPLGPPEGAAHLHLDFGLLSPET